VSTDYCSRRRAGNIAEKVEAGEERALRYAHPTRQTHTRRRALPLFRARDKNWRSSTCTLRRCESRGCILWITWHSLHLRTSGRFQQSVDTPNHWRCRMETKAPDDKPTTRDVLMRACSCSFHHRLLDRSVALKHTRSRAIPLAAVCARAKPTPRSLRHYPVELARRDRTLSQLRNRRQTISMESVADASVPPVNLIR